MSSKERDWSTEKDRLLESHRDEVVELEVQMEQMRNDLLKTKETLHDAITVCTESSLSRGGYRILFWVVKPCENEGKEEKTALQTKHNCIIGNSPW